MASKLLWIKKAGTKTCSYGNVWPNGIGNTKGRDDAAGRGGGGLQIVPNASMSARAAASASCTYTVYCVAGHGAARTRLSGRALAMRAFACAQQCPRAASTLCHVSGSALRSALPLANWPIAARRGACARRRRGSRLVTQATTHLPNRSGLRRAPFTCLTPPFLAWLGRGGGRRDSPARHAPARAPQVSWPPGDTGSSRVNILAVRRSSLLS